MQKERERDLSKPKPKYLENWGQPPVPESGAALRLRQLEAENYKWKGREFIPVSRPLSALRLMGDGLPQPASHILLTYSVSFLTLD